MKNNKRVHLCDDTHSLHDYVKNYVKKNDLKHKSDFVKYMNNLKLEDLKNIVNSIPEYMDEIYFADSDTRNWYLISKIKEYKEKKEKKNNKI